MMNTGQGLGLVLLYVVMAGNVVLMLRIFVQILFRAAIEKHRRRQFTERNGGAAYTPRGVVGKRGWANTWLPRNPEIIQPAQDGNSAGTLAGAAPIVKLVPYRCNTEGRAVDRLREEWKQRFPDQS